MTRIGMGVGGAQGIRTMGRATGAQDWRQPPGQPRASVDWSSPEHQTPKPAKTVKYPRRGVSALDDTPQLPERTMRVRAKPPATFYSIEGIPIPFDQWVDLPISPGLLKAVKQGDLEEDKTDKPQTPQRPQRPQPHPRPQPQQTAQPTQAE